MPISSVVLSGQHIDLKDALYTAAKGKDAAKNDAANPLVSNGLKLIPSVTRVFSTDRNLFVYLQAYAGGAATPAAADKPTTPMVAFVSLYRDQKKAFETAPIAVKPTQGSRLGMVPLNFTISLGGLTPGRYECQVSVLDPTDHRVAFWQGSIMLMR